MASPPGRGIMCAGTPITAARAVGTAEAESRAPRGLKKQKCCALPLRLRCAARKLLTPVWVVCVDREQGRWVLCRVAAVLSSLCAVCRRLWSVLWQPGVPFCAVVLLRSLHPLWWPSQGLPCRGEEGASVNVCNLLCLMVYGQRGNDGRCNGCVHQWWELLQRCGLEAIRGFAKL